ncbi:Uncharacterised protein [Bordetella pertussis]|nr:Uncharacterised protein [Bordetella pertussis]
MASAQCATSPDDAGLPTVILPAQAGSSNACQLSGGLGTFCDWKLIDVMLIAPTWKVLSGSRPRKASGKCSAPVGRYAIKALIFFSSV